MFYRYLDVIYAICVLLGLVCLGAISKLSVWFFFFGVEFIVILITFSIFIVSYFVFSSLFYYWLNMERLLFLGYSQQLWLVFLTTIKRYRDNLYTIRCSLLLSKIILKYCLIDGLGLIVYKYLSSLSLYFVAFYYLYLFIFLGETFVQMQNVMHLTIIKSIYLSQFNV